jgi:TonB family protein
MTDGWAPQDWRRHHVRIGTPALASSRLPACFVLAAFGVLACSRPDSNTVRLPENQPPRRSEDPPVAVNAASPVEYPPALFARGIEGKVILRLHVDELGRVASESTKVAESSGYPALDSAALAAVPRFRFAPALRNGTPVAETFMQPVHFRHPQAGGTTP